VDIDLLSVYLYLDCIQAMNEKHQSDAMPGRNDA